MQAVEVLSKPLRPKDIMTREAFENAGSRYGFGVVPLIQHFICRLVAHEAGVPLSWTILALHKLHPQLSKLSPSGKYSIEDLYVAGGVSAVETFSRKWLFVPDCKTVALKNTR